MRQKTLVEKIIEDILWRKREFTSHEEGYFDALMELDDIGNLSANHVLFLQSLYKRLYQKNS